MPFRLEHITLAERVGLGCACLLVAGQYGAMTDLAATLCGARTPSAAWRGGLLIRRPFTASSLHAVRTLLALLQQGRWSSRTTQVVWDGASGHRAPEVRRVGLTLLAQPPYAPELQPAERVFEELRPLVEGKVYATLEEKVAAVERELQALAANPERMQRLAGWQWVEEAWAALPPDEEPHALEFVA